MPMELRQLDSTDFAASIRGNDILVHEFEMFEAMLWHSAEAHKVGELLPHLSRSDCLWWIHHKDLTNEKSLNNK